MWLPFTTLPSWFTELRFAPSRNKHLPVCLFLHLILQTQLIVDHRESLTLIFAVISQFPSHCMQLILNFAQVTLGFNFIPVRVSSTSTHVFSLMSLRVRVQMSTLLQKSPESSLLFAPSVQPYKKSIVGLGPLLRSRIELSHWGPGAQDGTKSDKDKGLLKVPWAA